MIKKILSLIAMTLTAFSANAQAVEVDNYTTNIYEGKSYHYRSVVTLKPGFSVSASDGWIFSILSLKKGTLYLPPTTEANFVRTEQTLIPGIKTQDDLTRLQVANKEKLVTYSYADGLTRPIQTINVQASPTLRDIIAPSQYDSLGRMPNVFLPYAAKGTPGSLRSAAFADQNSFYVTPPSAVISDTRPYTTKTFEPSPLKRVTSETGVGAEWTSANKKVSTITRLNATGEVRYWVWYGGPPELSGTYPANTLIVEETTDEQGKITRKFLDLRGRLILQSVGDGTLWLETYYIYSVAGDLKYVISPEGTARISTEFENGANKQSFLDRWAFQYSYDDEQRVIAKRVPGMESGDGGWFYTVYDRWNRIVLTQDPEQRTRNEYRFIKYDMFNRPVITGVYVTSTSLNTLRNDVANSTSRYETKNTSGIGYTLTTSYPTTGITEGNLFTIKYYDEYSYTSNAGWDAEGNSYTYVAHTGYPSSTTILTTSAKGQLTGLKVRVLDQNKWLNTVTWYDKKYQPVQVVSENQVGGVVRLTKKFDFIGKIEKELMNNQAASLTIEKLYTYDHGGRQLTLSYSLNGATPVLMFYNRYNELGRLIERNIHSVDNGATFLQSIDFRYNIRGWLTQINNSTLTADGNNNDANDLFGMELQYNPSGTTIGSGTDTYVTKPFYDGNISLIKWMTDTRQPGSRIERIYGFDYDALSRMRRAWYATKNVSAWNGNSGMFDEVINGYDRNGNIKTTSGAALTRYGNVEGTKTIIDNLTYSYAQLDGSHSNRLIAMQDAGNSLGFKNASASVSEEYLYDKNGNLKFDHNKGISSITYNHLNLPKRIEFTRPDGQTTRIEYSYDASGTKLGMLVFKNNVEVWRTDYAGGAQYENGKLAFIPTEEGRIVYNGKNYEYEYFLKDHQGNVRVTYAPTHETVTYKATLETQLSAQEETDYGFKNVTQTRSVDANYTLPSERVLVPDKSCRTNGHNTVNQPIGIAKSLRVLNGDVVYAETYARYNQTTGSSSKVLPTILAGAVTSTFSIVSTENPVLWQNMNANAPLAATDVPSSTTIPRAYLVYLFFDDSGIFAWSQLKSISADAYNAFEKLDVSFTATTNGYLYIYVANESNSSSAVNVYFDEMKVIHQKNNTGLQVTQASDYYPFGMSFNTYQAERLNMIAGLPPEQGPGQPPDPGGGDEVYAPFKYNRILFQDQELQKDLDLGWYQYKWRMHDPVIGRFSSIDPLSDKFVHNSPYAFSENKVVSHVELEGLESVEVSLLTLASADAAAHPNGLGAHTLGIFKGLENSAVGLYNAVTNPGQTLTGLGNLALAGAAGNPAAALQMDAALGTNSYGAMMGTMGAISIGADNLLNGNGLQRGQVLGEIGGALIGTKGLNATFSAFRSTATIGELSTLFHSTSKVHAANIMQNGILPGAFNSASRFGKGFYLSNSVSTTAAELANKGATVGSTIQYSLGAGGKFLNATSPALDLAVRFTPKLLSNAARSFGYDGLITNSLRGSGTNLTMFRNFSLLKNEGLVP
ncbi:MAG TPA: DUF6443 domain-containing protein [Ohtaekwangia sp.]